MLDIRDDLLMSLLASEAIVDSRGCEILSAEEVEELKKVCTLLSQYIPRVFNSSLPISMSCPHPKKNRHGFGFL